MSVQFQPIAGCAQSAAEMQLVFALTVLHLFQSSFTPTPSSALADYTAAEATYDAYAAITLTAWFDPILAPGSGYMILSPAVQFAVGATDPVVPNTIGGLWMEDAAGNLRFTTIFTSPVPMQLAGQGIPIQLTWLFPTGL